MQRSPVEKESFYELLSECILKAKGDSIIVLGDFNARVGKDWQSWPTVVRKHGEGETNANGLMLLEFCTRFQLSMMSTMFQNQESPQEYLAAYAIQTLAPNRSRACRQAGCEVHQRDKQQIVLQTATSSHVDAQ